METGVRPQQGEPCTRPPLSDPTVAAVGVCPEMLEVAEEACRAGDFDLAAEIYGSQLADLRQPDRGLCLRKADALARAGRISEALDAYCVAASLSRLRPDELPFLVDAIARTLREKELGGRGGSEDGGGEEPPDLFSCRLCGCLLCEPATVECGHTFCRRCLDERPRDDCVICGWRPKADALPNGRRVNVVLSGLLDKLFGPESRGRKLWIEGEVLWKNQNFAAALDKLNAAADLGESPISTSVCVCVCLLTTYSFFTLMASRQVTYISRVQLHRVTDRGRHCFLSRLRRGQSVT